MNVDIPHERIRCVHCAPCWACSFDWDSPSRKHNAYFAALVYETCVEWMEARKTGFRMTDVWRAIAVRHGRGPTTWNVARNAVRDMAAHGLIVCSRKTNSKHGALSRCIEWRVI